ncbi:MAG: lipase family protein [Wolbachia sp.]
MTNQTDSLGSSIASLPSDNSSWIDLGIHETTGGRCHSGNSGTEREEGVEVLGGKSQETPAVPEDELGDFQCSSFGDDYEIIEVSDLDKIQIAGFSKQELLEMCNFCKISYGNNDEKLDSRYKTKAELINESYGIIPFYYKKNGTPAGFVFTKDKEITIAYRGTKGLDDVMTDVSAAFTQEFLPEGGKMHSGFYNAFYDLLPSLDKVLSDYIEKQESEIKDFKINCTGHSMGAALATITALYLKKVKDAEYVRVATFGSPRVFDFHGAEIYEKLLGENTIRVTNSSDPIPMFPSGSMGFKHVGKPLKIKTGNFVISCFGMSFCVVGGYYHKTDTYYNCIQDIKPEDFQPDNNVSRYYYFSYVVAAPYCMTTTILTTPYYLFLSAISNTERHYFEKEMKFADLIIHKNAMVGEDPLIMSHIECNINGRGEVPLYINNNGNSMELRQLCGTENISVRFLSSIGDNLVAGGSLAMRSTCSNSELSQQPQENIVNKRENIMNNREGLTEELISNSFEEGEMHSSDQNTKSIEEALSDAIFSLDCKEVRSLVERVKQEGNNVERIIGGALKKANETKVGKRDKGSKDKIKKIREFLAEELIAASLVGNDVKITASSHEAPVIESKESESDSLSSEGDDYSRLESGKSAGTSSGNGSPSEEVAVTSEMPSMATEEAKVNNEQSDNINDDDLTPVSSPVSGDILTSRSDEEESVVITTRQPNDSEHDKTVFKEHQGDAAIQNTQPKTLVVDSKPSNAGVESDEKKQAPVQPTEHVPGESVGLKAQPSNTQEQQEVPETSVLGQMDDTESLSTQDALVFQSDSTTVLSIDGDEKERAPVQPVESESKGDQQDSPPLSPQSSVSGDECSSGPSSFTKLPKSDEGDTDNNNDKYVKVSPENMTKEDLTPKGSGSLQGIQPEISVPSPSTFSIEDIEDSEDSSIVSKDSLIEDVTDEPEKTNKEDSTLKSSNSTKSSKLPIVAASALAVTGIAAGIAIAVYLEMLAVGVAVGACCLVAAVIIYCCNRPSSSFKGSNVELIADKELAATVS